MMSASLPLRVILDNPPDFYTNLDPVVGRVVLFTHRSEHVGAIVVKLEGEAKTHALDEDGAPVTECHKILYNVQQVFPSSRANAAMPGASFVLRPGAHEFAFRFKLPFNNVCSDVSAMAKVPGLPGRSFFGSGVRVMDPSRQMLLRHVRKTLPPSFMSAARRAEIRYYIKVTVQRPGLLRENWRHQVDFRFMPIEEPRPALSEAKAFAKRPFVFKPKSLAPTAPAGRKSALFGKGKQEEANGEVLPPSVEISAWFPHPIIITCNRPVPLQLMATKKGPSTEPVILTSIQIELIGTTRMRCFRGLQTMTNRFVVMSNNKLNIPLTKSPDDALGTEVQVPDDLWRNVPLPNTIAPSFITCNIMRSYQLEIKLGVSWATPAAKKMMFSNRSPHPNTQAIHLPLVFSDVKVYSGIAPPPEVLTAMANRPAVPTPGPTRPAVERPPRLPPRTDSGRPIAHGQAGMGSPLSQQSISPISGPNQVPIAVPDAPAPTAASFDPLYPPQLDADGVSTYDDAPPSYDEAMAADATGPVDRPAFSGESGLGGPTSQTATKDGIES